MPGFRRKGARPYTAVAMQRNWGAAERPSPSCLNSPNGAERSVPDRLARFAGIAPAGRVALHQEIDVRIVHALALGARADLEIERIARGAVDQAMGDAAAGLEARGVTGPEHGLAVVLLQHQLALQHVDELVLLLVPVA